MSSITAVHEAAHVLTAVKLGIEVQDVSIYGIAGITNVMLTPGWGPEWLRGACQFYCAGAIAEGRFTNAGKPVWCDGGPRRDDDLQVALDYAWKAASEARRHFDLEWAVALNTASARVDANWSSILDLARELDSRSYLDAAAIKAVLSRSPVASKLDGPSNLSHSRMPSSLTKEEGRKLASKLYGMTPEQLARGCLVM